MQKKLSVGMTLFHLNRRYGTVVRAVVQELVDQQVVVRLEEAVTGRLQLQLPLTSVGRFLFFSQDDAFALDEEIALRQEYRSFGNEKLLEIYGEQKRRRAIHEAKTALLGKLKQEYGFQGFLHYTDFSNFLQIMRDGYLYSRVRALQGRLRQDAANQSILRNTEYDLKKYARFFYRPNTPTLYCNEGIKRGNTYPHMPIPVLLVFSEDILYHDHDMLFLDRGGGNRDKVVTSDPREALEFD
jgi:hypothetical protein